MKINLLTQNNFKIETAKQAFNQFNIEVVPIHLDIPEIQAPTNAEIARHGALQAAKVLNEPVMIEDHGFYLEAFSCWPGPYMAQAEKSIPAEDILRLLKDKNKNAYFEMALAYATPDGNLLEFSFQQPCFIVDKPQSGNKDFGWDSIISLKVKTDKIKIGKTLSEYQQEDRYHFFTQNFMELAKELLK